MCGLAGLFDKPIGGWLHCVLLCASFVWACCSLVPCGNHAQLESGSGVERLMNTLAYGWVERCNDITSCGEASSQDKYSCVFNICKLFVF